MPDALYQISIWLFPVLIAITFHEAAHGYVAWRLGDDTAKNEGRVTFQPLRHVDTWGTVIIPGSLLLMGTPFIFGWAKPVPVDFMKLNNPRRDMVWVAAAGPGVNLALAFASAVLLHLTPMFSPDMGTWIVDNLRNSILINLVLAVFNMLPLPPLDGGRVAVGLLPAPLAIQLARLERVGLLIVILAFLVVPMVGREFGYDVNPLVWLLEGPVKALSKFVMTAAGHF